ncbi:MAG TPA: DUF4105 domain-containing protein [Rudaea sp.]|nr:DUF4105 domain-containing protein [Rudaea sp.]
MLALFAGIGLLIAAPAFAQQPAAVEPGSHLDISLVTFGPGTQVWERFGHNAILVQDRGGGPSLLYNYGMFDFAQKNFYVNFARGRMLYSIDVENPLQSLPIYVEEGRWIVRQDLNLTPAQRLKLANYLAWNARPENAQYRYDYFTANCSTRVRDALNMTLDGAIKAQTANQSRGFTYRMDTLRLMRPEPALMLGMDAGLGPFSDTPLSNWQESFVPMQFMQTMRSIRVTDANGKLQPLVAHQTLLAPARLPEPPAFPPNWFWQALAVGLGLGAMLFILARQRQRTWARITLASTASLLMLTLGLGGCVLIALWTLTDHVAAWHNQNLLLLDPLCLLLIPAWLRSAGRHWQPSRFAKCLSIGIATLAALTVLLKLAPLLAHQDNRFWIAVLLPIHLALAISIFSARKIRSASDSR